MHIAQTISGDVRVNFRRADVRMPQQFLDHAQIRAVFQQMRREAVSQHVRRNVAFNARAFHTILDAFPKRDRRKRSSASREKNICR